MTTLKPGFAYVEVQSIDTENKNGEPLITKNGQKMVKLVLSAVDTEGNKGYISDIVVGGIAWKINNVTTAFEVEKISKSLLVGRGAGAIIEHREYKGKDGLAIAASVKSYVPLAFFNMVSLVGVHGVEGLAEKVKEANNQDADFEKTSKEDNNLDDIPF